ncbi:TrkH family potassium uptake protein [Aristaeella hokkaidonensis]|uniref:Potassium uptake protein, TrkH family n=1 Tax=Aristaeella hokkaidonensis TaxID=3046382 RepID=A0AC61MUI7_9FIRM|nr:potassium transporter TrkG [Aristaeella hokkaidonensis]QUC65767.1 potassium uptake protein, TrkH family [Aristaeella hokkaidonensis]SNT94022.1 trk system potassium uptake protein TrkH [Aristaeella hokkaidonensis]
MTRGKPAWRPKKKRQSVSIGRIMAFTFLGIILLGTLLLTLPVLSRNGQGASVMTALFTATSATCVTGLVLADTWSQWSNFGQVVILMMIEVGGLGFMSAASLAYFSLRRKISIQQQLVMAEAIGSNMNDVVEHQKRLLIRAFTVEGVGAVILTARFLTEYSFPLALKLGIFHSVSAFCNAGFDVLGFIKPGASLIVYQTDPVICLTLSALVILGGLGFLVWDELLRERSPKKWSVYTKLVMITTGTLLLAGTVLFCLIEWRNPSTLGPLSVPKKILAAFFQSMTLRTAGFAGVDQGMLTSAGKAVSIFMMLIGGSSGSTAGGLKTVTFVVLLLFLWNRMRGRHTVSVFSRTISDDHVLNAITIFMLMVLLAFAGATLICATSQVGFADSLFETVSAIGTVGLTAGATPRLSTVSKCMIIVFMYFGRVGLLTLSFGFLKKKPSGEKYKYANTDLLIG